MILVALVLVIVILGLTCCLVGYSNYSLARHFYRHAFGTATGDDQLGVSLDAGNQWNIITTAKVTYHQQL